MSNAATETLTVTVERDFPFPPDKVWRALTQPQLIEEWLMKSDDFKPEVGHRFKFTQDWGTVDCEVVAIEPTNKLAYSWNYRQGDPTFDLNSIVTFTLTPTATGTHLRMEQTGFRPDQPKAYKGAQYGWKGFLEAMEKLLARDA